MEDDGQASTAAGFDGITSSLHGKCSPFLSKNVELVLGENERLHKIQAVVRREFDVEILHKWREVRILEEELDKAMQLRGLLEKLLLNGMLIFYVLLYNNPLLL